MLGASARGEQVQSSTDRFGTKTFSYATAGDAQPAQMTDPFGAVILFDYDSTGRLQHRTERGLTTTMAYDDLGRKTSVDYGNGSKVSFGYTTGKPDWTSLSGTNPQSAVLSCAGDSDCDGVLNSSDNCPSVPNATQADADQNDLTIGGATAVWRLDETSGTTATDSASRNLHQPLPQLLRGN